MVEELAKLVLSAPALNVALLCVVLALGVLFLKARKKSKDDGATDYPGLTSALARFEAHMTWAEDEIKAMKTKVDPLVIAVATLNVIVGALKEKVEENHEQLDKKLDRVLDKLDNG